MRISPSNDCKFIFCSSFSTRVYFFSHLLSPQFSDKICIEDAMQTCSTLPCGCHKVWSSEREFDYQLLGWMKKLRPFPSPVAAAWGRPPAESGTACRWLARELNQILRDGLEKSWSPLVSWSSDSDSSPAIVLLLLLAPLSSPPRILVSIALSFFFFFLLFL